MEKIHSVQSFSVLTGSIETFSVCGGGAVEWGIMIEAQSDKEEAEAPEQKLSNNKNIENQQFKFESIKNAESETLDSIPFFSNLLRSLALSLSDIMHASVTFHSFPEPSIIHVILLNRTLRILCLLGIFCTLIPVADYFYFYSSQIVEQQTDDSGTSICSHYPIYQIPCGVEVSRKFCAHKISLSPHMQLSSCL